MIKFACPSCGKELSVKDEAAGKRGKCPRCSSVIVVPAAMKSMTSPPSTAKPQYDLDYRFFNTLNGAFEAPILAAFEKSSDDVHERVQQYNAEVLTKDWQTGVTKLIEACSESLKPHISGNQMASLAEAIREERKTLLPSLRPLLDTLTRTGNRVIDEVSNSPVEQLFNAAVTCGFVAGQFGLFAGAVSALQAMGDADEMETREGRIIQDWSNALKAVCEQMDKTWEALYDRIHKYLREKCSVRTLSLQEVQDLRERFTAYIEEAKTHIDANHHEEGLDCLDRAIELCPGEVEPHKMKGSILCQLGRADELLSSMEKFRSLGSVSKDDLLWSYYGTGWAYAAKNDYTHAMEALRKVVQPGQEEHLHYADAYYTMAGCCAESGDNAHCLEYLERAVEAGYSDIEEIAKEEAFSAFRNDSLFKSILSAGRMRTPRLINTLLVEKGGKFYRPADFGSDKLVTAKKRYVHTSDGEEIVCIYDSTVFGGAKEGICFTDRAVYWKDLLEEPHRLAYKEIESIDVSEDGIALNGIKFSSDGAEDRANIVILLKKLCPNAALSEGE